MCRLTLKLSCGGHLGKIPDDFIAIHPGATLPERKHPVSCSATLDDRLDGLAA